MSWKNISENLKSLHPYTILTMTQQIKNFEGIL